VRKLSAAGCALFLFSLPVSAREVEGTLLNDEDPYFIKGDDGSVYKAEWSWGFTPGFFFPVL
jgi:hypothetical protein